MGWPHLLLIAILATLLAWAAVDDLRWRTIPNWLNIAIALAAPLWWWALALPLWPDVALQLGVAAFLFALFAGAFAIGAMGGGDVKLIAALALWLPLVPLMRMLTVMALLGGVITLVMLVLHRLRRAAGRPEIPYGVAISIAGLWSIANDILTTGAARAL